MNSAVDIESGALVSADAFVSAALADPSIVRFLDMRTARADHRAQGSDRVTLRSALRDLAKDKATRPGPEEDGGGGGSSVLRQKVREGGMTSGLLWGNIEQILFDPYNPATVYDSPPSTTTIGTPSASRSSSQSSLKRDDDHQQGQEREVTEAFVFLCPRCTLSSGKAEKSTTALFPKCRMLNAM